MDKQELPEELHDNADYIKEVEIEDLENSPVQLLENRNPTGAWYVVCDGEIIKQGSKIDGINEAVGFAKGFEYGLEQKSAGI